ncbi:hypothetical protein [Aureimonas sp. AU20]|uniref:hypothetical protein n=1 Tax=Aureimonas sp. AU20 TaxID=1349819 RepID=UPI0007209948|nr:hypothetical protein [Aureimonas sp. AU20]ALN73543.1 hypothetical protein M673_12520 [Aureimonas sp. AU20]
MSNAVDPRDAYFAAKGITDPDAIAYLKRYPEVGAAVEQYGPNTAQIHYATFGKDAGWVWGREPEQPAAQPAQAPAAAAMPSMYGNGADNWDSYRKQAQAATQGINQMPFVFSDYGSIPTDDKAANALLYAGSATAPAVNPLLAGITSAAQLGQAMDPTALLLGSGPLTSVAPTKEQRIAAQYGNRY